MSKAVDNPLRIWEQVETTDPGATKAFTRGGGFRGTAINPCYVTKQLTSLFGPNGIGWTFVIDNEQYVQGHTLRNGDKAILHVIRGHIAYFVDGAWVHGSPQFGQTGLVWENSSGTFTDEEAPKKSVTDCLTKCAVLLGFSADIHLGLWDGNKYVNSPDVKPGTVANPFKPPTDGPATAEQPAVDQAPAAPPKDRRPKAAPPPPTSSKAVEVLGNSPKQLLEFATGLNRAVYAPEDWEDQCRAIANRKRELALPEAAETITLNDWLREQRAFLDSFVAPAAPEAPPAEPKKRGRPAGSKNKKIDS